MRTEAGSQGKRAAPAPKRIWGFKHAVAGIVEMLKAEPNARVHAGATVAVGVVGAFVELSRLEWCWIVVAVVMVWAAEALNTAVEALADALLPRPHPGIKQAKDVAAGAVLIAALGAVVIGVLVLGPHLLAFIGG